MKDWGTLLKSRKHFLNVLSLQVVVLSNFIVVLQHVVEPVSYDSYNDENEPTLFAYFYAVQNASANRDVHGRRPDAKANPTGCVPAEL